jgi:4-amino-4-deoxy-L-arabinose transferase-like glycosyltransferase
MVVRMQPVAELRLAGGARNLAGRFLASYAARVWTISVAGLLGRLLFIGYQPLWRDEAFTAVVVQRPLGQMLAAVRGDSAPPLLYLVDHAVTAVSASASALRLVPALAGAAAIPIIAALGRRIGGDRAGVMSAVLAAVAPALVLSARDARMYALATTVVLAATLLLLRAVERPSLGRWGAYAGVTALALYTDYFAVLAVGAQLLAVPLVLHAGVRRTLAAAAAAGAGAVTLIPWLIAAHAQLGHTASTFWVPPVSLTTASGAYVQFLSGPPADDGIPGKPLLLTMQGFAVASGVFMAFTLLVRRHRLTPAGRRTAVFCAACGLGAAIALLLLSLWRPLLTGSYASVVWGPLFPLLGAGLALVAARWVVVAGLAATAAASITLSAGATHPQTQSAIAMIEARLGPHDLVDAHPSQYLLFLYYADRAVLDRTVVVSSDVQWYWGTAAYPPGAVVAAAPSDVTTNNGVIYYVRRPDEAPPTVPTGYAARSTQCWTGVCVTAYRR